MVNYKDLGLVNTREMFKNAMAGKYAIAAFNFNNMEQMQAIIQAAVECKSPVILQVSSGARKYANQTLLRYMAQGAVEYAKELGLNIPITLHLDHGDSFELCKSCIDMGFSSVMIDGSHLPYDENVALTKKVVEYAHQFDVTVEGELGVLAGVEDEVSAEHHTYTRPEEVEDFVKKTGVDSLAISIGTSHGANKFKPEQCTRNADGVLVPPPLRFDILKEIAKNSLDYAYISQSQAFFAVCDSRGDPLVSRDSEFYLFLLFLQDLSSSALPQATGQQMMKVDLFFLSPSRFQSAILKQTRQITLHIPQQEVVQALFKSCFLYSFYHSIVSNGVGNSGELKKFLTNEDCCAGAINNDFSVLLRVLPFLSEEECDAMDAELVRCLKSLNCTVFDDYMIVNCDAYPCFIRVDVTLMLQKSLKKTKVAEEAFCDE